MESLIEKLRVIFVEKFPGSQDTLEREPPSKKVGGFLIWDGFSGKEPIDRQHQLWDVLRSKLAPDDQQKITAILTVTRAEWSAITQELHSAA